MKQTAKKVASKTLTFIGILLFINGFSWLFGSANLIIGVAVSTGIMVLKDVDLGVKPWQGIITVAVLFPMTGVMALLSQWNVWAAVGIHFLTVLALMVLTSAPLSSKAYLPFLLCYIFAQGNPVWGHDAWMRVLGLTLGGLASGVVYWAYHRKKQQKRTVGTLVAELPRWSLRSDFIWRVTIGVTIAMTAASLMDAGKPMWVSIVVMSLTQPFMKDTLQRTLHRGVATVVGVILFVLLFQFLIPMQYSSYALLLLGYVYNFVSQYKVQQVFVTINALSAAMILFDPGVSIFMRVSLLLVGIAIVLVVSLTDTYVVHRLADRFGRSRAIQKNTAAQTQAVKHVMHG